MPDHFRLESASRDVANSTMPSSSLNKDASMDIEDIGSVSVDPSPAPSTASSPRARASSLSAITLSVEDCPNCHRSDCPSLQPPQPGYFTRAQVAQHNTPTDCWITSHGIVYDVTRFLHSHPGGEAALLRRARTGQDASQDYDFHSTLAKRVWLKMAIGRLSECPRKPAAQQGDECAVM